MSGESVRQAADADQVFDTPQAASARARGSTSSMILEFRQEARSFSSVRQSTMKRDPRLSATRRSLLVLGWDDTEARGWGKAMG